ncbi:MAG TPA: C4-type zinc ribbon domain-containing protein [Anaerolineaceae bacterium]|nr:C4-type zinc ribbon domain-containing protein [Anaerolineaceae bacterium]HPN51169.1 C4-type zinc ribbon domain-containing protein [Anaerolineaceae bacterium]
MSQIFHLYRLQKMDTRRAQISLRLAEISRILSTDPVLAAAQQRHAKAEQTQKTAHSNLRSAENAVQAMQIKLEQNQSTLYGGRVQNPKELNDLQNEQASLKKHLSMLEDEQLAAMEAMEEAEKGTAAAVEQLNQALAAAATSQAALLGEKVTLEKEMERLESERLAILPSIPAPDLELYNRLSAQKRGLAVADIQDDSCGGCGNMLSPAMRQAARSPSQVNFCPSCGRILYAG